MDIYVILLSGIFIGLSYLLGSIPIGLIVSIKFKGIDVREYGSGKTGTTNILRTIGVFPAVLVIILDILKGGIPIIIYNIPGRSVVDMSVQTMARLSKITNIIGVKDATGDASRPSLVRHLIGNDFCQLSGEDGCVPAMLAHGGHGCISVTANVAPSLCAQMHEDWQKGNLGDALATHDKLTPLNEALFSETSPGPVKYAASLIGLCESETRLPLAEIKQTTKTKRI